MKNTYMKKNIVTTLVLINTLTLAQASTLDQQPTAPYKSYVAELDAAGNVVDTFGLQNVDTKPTKSKSSSKQVVVADNDSEGVEFITYTGQEAIDRLGVDLDTLSQKHNITPDYLKEQLLNDNTLKIDSDGNLLFVEENVDEIAAADLNKTPPSAIPFTGDAFKLHSKPNATKKIYIDFDGYVAHKTAWMSSGTITAAPFNLDGNMGIDTIRERTAIYHIWASVAEDFLPFDVDVTTEEPTPDELLRSNATDQSYGTRAVVTHSASVKVCSNCGGVAYVGVFNYVGSDYFKPAWIFYNALGSNNKAIAEAISHEVGHNLGLYHDGVKNGSAYYMGAGTWAPIMGVGYYKPITQWNNGTYPNANNNQDDIATIISKGLVNRQDDYDNTISQATSFTSKQVVDGNTIINPQYGIIETQSDVDMFSFTNQYDGKVEFNINPTVINIDGTTTLGNLDATLTLYDSTGKVLMVDSPQEKTTASITKVLPMGTYYVGVSSSGKSVVGNVHGYNTYGSLGQYTVSGQYTSEAPPSPPVAKVTASATTGEAPLVVGFSGVDSVKGSSNIKSYYWSFGNGKYSTSPIPNTTYATPGTYTVSLKVTDDNGLTSSVLTKVNVTAPLSKTVFVNSMSVRYQTVGSMVNATAIISVLDNTNKVVPNVTVYGKFSGTLYSLRTGTVKINETEVKGYAVRNGVVGITSPRYMNAAGTFNFTVTKVVVNKLTYNPLANKVSTASITKR